MTAVSIYTDSIRDLHNRFHDAVVHDYYPYDKRILFQNTVAALGTDNKTAAEEHFRRLRESLSPQEVILLKQLMKVHAEARKEQEASGTALPPELIAMVDGYAGSIEALYPPIKPPALTTHFQRGLLILTVVTAILASIHPLRLVGSLVGRGIAIVSSCTNCVLHWNENKVLKNKSIVYFTDNLLKIAKIGIVVAGALAVCTKSSLLLTASLISDVALQALEFLKAAHRGEVLRASIHLASLTVNVLTLVAVTTASWQWMVAATAVSCAAMIVIGSMTLAYQRRDGEIIDAICYFALAILGFTNSFLIAQYTNVPIAQTKFTIKNPDDRYTLRVYPTEGNGKLLGTVAPGETGNFTMEGRHYALFRVWDGPLYPNHVRYNEYIYGPIEITSPALPPQLFGTVPVGSSAVVIPAPRRVHIFDPQ